MKAKLNYPNIFTTVLSLLCSTVVIRKRLKLW